MIIFVDIKQSCSSNLTIKELNMCISCVSTEKGETTQLQEISEPNHLQESSKTILDNCKQHPYKKLRD